MPSDRLTDLDWQIIGADLRRLEIPMPNDTGGLRVLAHRFADLSQQLHRAADTPQPTRSAIFEAAHLITHANQIFKGLLRDWREQRQKTDAEPNLTAQ